MLKKVKNYDIINHNKKYSVGSINMRINVDSRKINYELIKRSKITFKKNSKTNLIYHYTSIGGLSGIVSNKKLRFTNIKYMNDKDEIIAGMDSFARYFDVTDEKKEELVSNFVNLDVQNFVCCFSLESDSLPMWNYYTKEINNQGYNIEFCDKLLVESILLNNPCLEGCNISFGVVDYSEADYSKYCTTINNAVLSSMNLAISKLFLEMFKMSRNKVSIDEEKIKKFEETIAYEKSKSQTKPLPIYSFNGQTCSFDTIPIADYICFIKRDCFKQEREFRIVISVANDQLYRLKNEGVYKFRISNGALIPYLELNFSSDIINSITISPTVQSDLIEQSIKDFATYSDLEIDDYSTFIRKSKIPVRF